MALNTIFICVITVVIGGADSDAFHSLVEIVR